MLQEQQGTILVKSNVQERTHILPENTSWLHLHNWQQQLRNQGDIGSNVWGGTGI
jgi:hypothetical protein